jgi:hypothetical protein
VGLYGNTDFALQFALEYCMRALGVISKPMALKEVVMMRGVYVAVVSIAFMGIAIADEQGTIEEGDSGCRPFLGAYCYTTNLEGEVVNGRCVDEPSQCNRNEGYKTNASNCSRECGAHEKQRTISEGDSWVASEWIQRKGGEFRDVRGTSPACRAGTGNVANCVAFCFVAPASRKIKLGSVKYGVRLEPGNPHCGAFDPVRMKGYGSDPISMKKNYGLDICDANPDCGNYAGFIDPQTTEDKSCILFKNWSHDTDRCAVIWGDYK